MATLALVAVLDTWRWDEEAFVVAWEAGVFRDRRVELVEGEVWPVSIGVWHGAVAGNVTRALPDDHGRITTSSLPAGGSVPDPDVWVHRRGAQPVSRLGSTGRLARWSAGDVALVVEVADTSLIADLEIKPRVYGRAGYPVYWVVHRGGVEVFSEPYESGYRQRSTIPAAGRLTVPYRSDVELAVTDLLDAED
jgi:hypothetical protein